jgi:hypothetical protein
LRTCARLGVDHDEHIRQVAGRNEVVIGSTGNDIRIYNFTLFCF